MNSHSDNVTRLHQADGSPKPRVIRQRLNVPYEFPVCFTSGLFKADNMLLVDTLCALEPERRQRAFVIVDGGVAETSPHLVRDIKAYFQAHSSGLDLVSTPRIVLGGEPCKNDPELVYELQETLQREGMDRQSHVIAIGGGAMLDMVGYVAATTHRGIRLTRVPTTVLSQNDSGVGVKNGVNAFDTKNFLGTFAPPFAVLNDMDFIQTLETRDKRAGMAEAVKVSLIRDPEFFHWMESNAPALARFEPDAMSRMIQRCAELHMAHIAGGGDPFEFGSARPLDFGHWAAHKLEAMTHYELRHGEAVAIGLALDCRYSVEIGLLDERDQMRIHKLLETMGFTLKHDALADETALLRGLREFREHLGGELSITLIRAVGDALDVHQMAEDKIRMALRWLRAV